MTIIPIDDLLEILDYGRPGTIRPAEPDEEPDFIKNTSGTGELPILTFHFGQKFRAADVH